MSDLANIRKRLSSAYSEPTSGGDAFGHGPGPEAEGAATSVTAEPVSRAGGESDGRHLGRRALRIWLGGAGVLAGSAVLFLGYYNALYAFSLAVVTFLVAFAVIHGLERLEKRSANRAVARSGEPSDDARLLSTIHDALGDIALTRTMDRRIVQANATFREMTRCPVPQGLTCEEIGLAFRPGAVPHNFDVEIATPYGQRIFVWHDIITRDPATGQLLLQSIGRDVTDERVKARAREEARLKAEDTSAAKSRLLATVSHEIRTPLSGILGMPSSRPDPADRGAEELSRRHKAIRQCAGAAG